MVRRWVARSVVGLSCLGVAACQPMTGSGDSSGGNAQSGPSEKAPPEIGSPLYKPATAEQVEQPGVFRESVIIPGAVVRLDKKQQVPAEVDGKIELIGTPVAKGPLGPTDKDLFHNPADQSPPEERVKYRRLREGDRVQAGAVVAAINDLDAAVQIEAAMQVKEASDRAIVAAREGTAKIRELLAAYKKGGNAIANTEVLNAEAQVARFIENEMQSEQAKAKAVGEEKRAQTLRSKHYPQSKVNGIIVNILRQPGEYVRAGDTIMEVLSTDEMRVEGNLEASYAAQVFPGQRVTVEPTMPIGPDPNFGGVYHQLDVTGVAVTANKDRPLIVSVSLDGTATVWDAFPPAGKKPAQTRLPHGVAVRSVAVTGAAAGKQWVATGGDDGKVRLWDASNPDKLSEQPAKVFEDAHAAAVMSVAFSPDGRFVASAAGREVFVWDAAAGKKLYALPGDHKDAVTSVRFTPQAALVTAARDRSLRVWKLGDKAAALERSIDHRKGNVDTLGVSAQGGRALFDQEDGRIDVLNLANGLPVGRIQNPAAGARFATLAVFSLDDKFVLTAGGDGETKGELQLWDTPQAGSRAAERRRLVTRDRAAPTCAAFSPDPARRFVVVGTQSGGVHVWTEAAVTQASSVRTGRVASVVRMDGKTVKVRVETDPAPADAAGPADVLQDKGTATIIIRPGEAAAAAGTAAVVPAGGVVSPMPVVPAGGLVVPAVPGGVNR